MCCHEPERSNAPQVKRDILYGGAPRNRLDLYLPAGCRYDPEATERAVRGVVTTATAGVGAMDPGGSGGGGSGGGGDRGGGDSGRGARRGGGSGSGGDEGGGVRGGEESHGGGDGTGRPVIVFITGGMWIIGYKAWGALLAQSLMKQGFIVASLDYRNFPQGTVGDMVQDVGVGIGWVVKRAAALGGDPQRVVVIGQSAGEEGLLFNR